MRKGIGAAVVMVALGMVTATAFAKADAAAKGNGEAQFKKRCASCHPDGGNIVNPAKTLKKQDLDTNKIKGVQGIVKYLRNPGSGMPKFDAKALPDKDAKDVAEYILKTFK